MGLRKMRIMKIVASPPHFHFLHFAMLKRRSTIPFLHTLFLFINPDEWQFVRWNFITTTFFILSILLSTLSYCLLLFLNALENCFLAQLSDLRGCIFFFPSSLLLCLLSRCIQSQYAFTLMALILILCPLAPLQLTAVTSLGESKQK